MIIIFFLSHEASVSDDFLHSVPGSRNSPGLVFQTAEGLCWLKNTHRHMANVLCHSSGLLLSLMVIGSPDKDTLKLPEVLFQVQ